MRLPQDYDSESLIEAIVALDWSTDQAKAATRLIQSTIADRGGERLGDEDAVWVLGSLLNRRLIRMQVPSRRRRQGGSESETSPPRPLRPDSSGRALTI